MNLQATRHTQPAAARAPRAAAGTSAPPDDPGLDALFADPRISSTAKALVAVLIRNWARTRDHCWPSDRTLARTLGRSVGHVQRCLRELERAGWILRERTDAVPNGRRIWLLWRRPAGALGAARPSAPARTRPGAGAQRPPAPARSEFEEGELEEGRRNVTRLSPNPGPGPSPTPAAVPPASPPGHPGPAPVLAPPPAPAPAPAGPPVLGAPVGPGGPPRAVPGGPPALPEAVEPSTPVRPLPDELKALPGADAHRVRSVAWRLARFLGDVGSIGFFIWVLAQVAAGTAAVERLLAAFRAGAKAKSGAKKPGAVFTMAWQTWSPPPSPSAINRPRYHRAAPAVRASPPGVGDPPPEAAMGREEEIALLQSWLARPRPQSPNYARMRLAELGVAT